MNQLLYLIYTISDPRKISGSTNLYWVLNGPPWPKTNGFCDLLGTPYAPVSNIPYDKNIKLDNMVQFKIGIHTKD